MDLDRNWSLHCFDCGSEMKSEPPTFLCPKCGGTLELSLRRGFLNRRTLFSRSGSPGIWRHKLALPPVNGLPVSLGEGSTPLLRSTGALSRSNRYEVYVKVEGQNPTGSFKDRGMTVAITRAKQRRAESLICASTGNTSASLAAYAAKAGMRAVVVIPSGKVASGKLVQAVAYGAKIVRVKGNFDKALESTIDAVSKDKSLYLMNSLNPFRIEGQKTAAYEIYEQLGHRVPDAVVMPVGNAGNISALWKGFEEMRVWGITRTSPRMIGVQAAGAAPIYAAYLKGAQGIEPVEAPETIASAIRIGRPVSWKKALRAMKDSGGACLSVTDKEIISARSALSSSEGIFVEAASAAPVAALGRLPESLRKGSKVVCVATGNGLKDQESVRVALDEVPLVDGDSDLHKSISSA
ncbi:MAG TPA: threonine synthase [Nitrososphaerales archaeon]|nr:threonine synthase [Nitrososphaerales archaeon]